MITLIIIWILWQRTCHIHIWHWLFCLETMVFLLPTTAIVLGDGYSRNAPCFMLVFRHTILIKRTVLFYVLCSSLVMCTKRNRNNQNGIAVGSKNTIVSKQNSQCQICIWHVLCHKIHIIISVIIKIRAIVIATRFIRIYARVDILLTCGKYLHDLIALVRGEVLAHITTLIPTYVIEVPVAIQEIQRPCICRAGTWYRHF
jgi:hypothetical protein